VIFFFNSLPQMPNFEKFEVFIAKNSINLMCCQSSSTCRHYILLLCCCQYMNSSCCVVTTQACQDLHGIIKNWTQAHKLENQWASHRYTCLKINKFHNFASLKVSHALFDICLLQLCCCLEFCNWHFWTRLHELIYAMQK
jgi:hypothetical protein